MAWHCDDRADHPLIRIITAINLFNISMGASTAPRMTRDDSEVLVWFWFWGDLEVFWLLSSLLLCCGWSAMIFFEVLIGIKDDLRVCFWWLLSFMLDCEWSSMIFIENSGFILLNLRFFGYYHHFSWIDDFFPIVLIWFWDVSVIIIAPWMACKFTSKIILILEFFGHNIIITFSTQLIISFSYRLRYSFCRFFRNRYEKELNIM